MTLENRFDNALNSSNALAALRSLVGELSTGGSNKATILKIFEQQRQRLRVANRESDEDIVMEVMDALAGWCHPGARLLPDEELEEV